MRSDIALHGMFAIQRQRGPARYLLKYAIGAKKQACKSLFCMEFFFTLGAGPAHLL